MTDLIPFLRDVTRRVNAFATPTSFIHMKPLEDGRLLAVMSSDDGNVHLKSTSSGPMQVPG